MSCFNVLSQFSKSQILSILTDNTQSLTYHVDIACVTPIISPTLESFISGGFFLTQLKLKYIWCDHAWRNRLSQALDKIPA